MLTHAANLRMFDVKDRTLGIFGALDKETCLEASEAIVRLTNTPARKPLQLYLGCHGGDVSDVFMILDCLATRRGRLHTYLMTNVTGMGLLLFAAGDQRVALPHASISTECLKRPAGVGFNPTISGSRDGGIDSLIHQYLEQRLGAQITSDLLDRSEIGLASAMKIGLVHKIIHSAKTPAQPQPARINRSK